MNIIYMDTLLVGLVGVADIGNLNDPTITFNPYTGEINCLQINANGNVINLANLLNQLNQVELDIASVETDVLALQLAQDNLSNNQNDANTYFNDINVAIQGLQEAVVNDQININQLQQDVANIPDLSNQILLSTSNLVFKVNLSSSPQVSFNANGSTLPFLSVERNFSGDFANSVIEPSGLSILHSFTSIGSDEVPYSTFSDLVAGSSVSIYSGVNQPDPSYGAGNGSVYLRTNGDILSFDGSDWLSYKGAILGLGSQVNSLENTVDFKETRAFYVSPDGNDLTGLGTQLQPFKTIQKAVSDSQLIASSSIQTVVYVGPGTYTEDINITVGYIAIIGATGSAQQSGFFNLVGDITINIPGNDLFQNHILLQGLIQRGSIVSNGVGEHSLQVQDYRIVVPNTRSYAFRAIEPSPGFYVNRRLRLINVAIQENDATAFTDPLIEVQGGWLTLERVDATAKSNITAVKIGNGAFLLRMALCSFETTSTSTSLPPQIWFAQTSAPPLNTIQTIAQTTITSASASGVRITGGGGLNTVIYMDTGVSSTSLSLYGVVGSIAGTVAGSGDWIQNAHATAVNVIYSDIFALPGTAHKFGSNLTKVPLQPII